MSTESFFNVAAPILNALIVDVIGVFTQTGRQVFRAARPLKATVKPTAKLPEHPLESGGQTSDHIIFNPIEVELSLILLPGTYRQAYQEITQLYKNAEKLIVRTRADNYDDMVISELPHDETSENYDSLVLALKLRQVLTVTSSYEPVPSKAENKSTVDRGTVSATPVEKPKSDLLQLKQSSFGG